MPRRWWPCFRAATTLALKAEFVLQVHVRGTAEGRVGPHPRRPEPLGAVRGSRSRSLGPQAASGTVDQRPLPFESLRSGQLNPSCYADPPMSSEPTGVPAHRSPDGTWRVVRTRRPSSRRNDRSRWHERHEDRVGGGRRHAAFERRRDALVFLDTTAAAPGSENVTTAPAKRRETTEPSQEPSQSSPRRTPKGPITHDLDETRSQDIPWSLCGVLLYDPRQIAKAGEPATCGSASGSGRRPATGTRR